MSGTAAEVKGADTSLVPVGHNCNRAESRGERVHRLTRRWREGRARELAARESDWHRARARGLRRKPDSVRTCGTEPGLQSTCTSGHRVWYARRCGDRLCDACVRAAGRRIYARMMRSVGHHMATRPRGWGLVMVTLTLAHQGSMEERCDRLMRAWARHRAWLDRRFNGRRKPRQPLRYWAVAECTEGRDGQGHPHLHVVMLAPRYDWTAAREAWARHADGHASPAGYWVSRSKRTSSAASVARYVAKYVGKGSAGLSDRVAAQWWTARYGRRIVTAMRGAWLPPPDPHCPVCGDLDVEWALVLVAAPEHSGHASLRPP